MYAYNMYIVYFYCYCSLAMLNTESLIYRKVWFGLDVLDQAWFDLAVLDHAWFCLAVLNHVCRLVWFSSLGSHAWFDLVLLGRSCLV